MSSVSSFRAFVTDVNRDTNTIVVQQTQPNPRGVPRVVVVPIDNIIGNRWCMGWHGTVVIESNKTIFYSDN